MSAEHLVFVDESGANTQMTQRGGRSPVGQRLAWPIPHGHYQTTTMIAAVREAIEGAGARLEYLPPYLPDLNPIEPMWRKVKQGWKSREPRNDRQLHKAAGAAFAAVTPADCQGFF